MGKKVKILDPNSQAFLMALSQGYKTADVRIMRDGEWLTVTAHRTYSGAILYKPFDGDDFKQVQEFDIHPCDLYKLEYVGKPSITARAAQKRPDIKTLDELAKLAGLPAFDWEPETPAPDSIVGLNYYELDTRAACIWAEKHNLHTSGGLFVVCDTCNGTGFVGNKGYEHDYLPRPCPTCDGAMFRSIWELIDTDSDEWCAIELGVRQHLYEEWKRAAKAVIEKVLPSYGLKLTKITIRGDGIHAPDKADGYIIRPATNWKAVATVLATADYDGDALEYLRDSNWGKSYKRCVLERLGTMFNGYGHWDCYPGSKRPTDMFNELFNNDAW